MPTNDEYFIFYSILTLSTLPACGWAVSNCYQSPRSAQARVDSVLFDLDTIYLDIYVCSIFCSNFCQLLAVCLDGESLDAWKTPPRVRTRRHVRLDTTTETTRETQDNCSVPAPPRPSLVVPCGYCSMDHGAPTDLLSSPVSPLCSLSLSHTIGWKHTRLQTSRYKSMYGINVVNFLLFLVTLCLVGQQYCH